MEDLRIIPVLSLSGEIAQAHTSLQPDPWIEKSKFETSCCKHCFPFKKTSLTRLLCWRELNRRKIGKKHSTGLHSCSMFFSSIDSYSFMFLPRRLGSNMLNSFYSSTYFQHFPNTSTLRLFLIQSKCWVAPTRSGLAAAQHRLNVQPKPLWDFKRPRSQHIQHISLAFVFAMFWKTFR